MSPAPRPIRDQDLLRVAQIEAESFPDPWTARSFAETLRRHGVVGLAVEDGSGRLAGYGICSLAADEGEILNLAVGQASRGQGLGRVLLRAMLAQLRLGGVRSVFLEVRPSNEAAIALYRDEGFKVFGTRQAYYRQPREDALTMVLLLGRGPHEKDEGMREIG